MRVWSALVLLAALGSGCASRLDRFVIERPIAEALRLPDVDLACRSGNANVPIAAGLTPNRPPHRALAILETTAAACSEKSAMEAELRSEQAAVLTEGEVRVAWVKDAREAERRHRVETARRLWRSWAHLEAAYGPVGGACPQLRREVDEFTWLLGLVAGANALLQDQAGGGQVGVPQDILGKIARGAPCLDDATWWYAPSALAAGSWAMVPGSGPAGVDPWKALDEAASKGDTTGVRIARAVQVQLLANAGREEDVVSAIQAFAKGSVPPPERWALLDAYAGMVVRHQADLLQVRARGFRSADLADLPGAAAPATPGTDAPGVDPFGADPFGADPFGEN
jgi:hypothetical protein